MRGSGSACSRVLPSGRFRVALRLTDLSLLPGAPRAPGSHAQSHTTKRCVTSRCRRRLPIESRRSESGGGETLTVPRGRFFFARDTAMDLIRPRRANLARNMTAESDPKRRNDGTFGTGNTANPGGRPRLPPEFTAKGAERLRLMGEMADNAEHPRQFDALRWCLERQYGKAPIAPEDEKLISPMSRALARLTAEMDDDDDEGEG